MLAYRTRQAVFVVKDKDKVGCSSPGFTLRAAHANLSIRTSNLFVLPINVKLCMVEGTFDTVLPGLAGRNRTDKINPSVLAVHQKIYFQIAFIHQVRLR